MVLTSDERQLLIQAAIASKVYSYSPFSHFRVGSALMDANGKVFTGVNVENSSYGLSICAERTAYTKAISEGAARPFKGIVVSSDVIDTFVYPCGACRQFACEFGEHEIVVVKPNGDYQISSVSEILPNSFTPVDLNKPRIAL